MHIGKVIGDVDIRNRGQIVHLPQNQRCQPVGKGPQKHEHRAGHIAGRAQRQGDGKKTPHTAGTFNFRSFLKRGIDIGKTRRKAQNDKGQHVQSLNEHQSVAPVNEIDGLIDQPEIHKEQIQGSIFTKKDNKGKHPGKSR